MNGFAKKEKCFSERGKLLLEHLPARPHFQVDVLPVIESRTLHLALIEREAERLDEMQRGSGGETCAARVAGVPVNLRMDEYDVCRQWSLEQPDLSLDRFDELRGIVAHALLEHELHIPHVADS